MAGEVLNAFSVDVEDYFQVSAFEGLFPRELWEKVPLRVEKGLRTLLDLAADADVHGTFYVLGWLARARPDLIRAIADAGHEVGCHSDEHRLVYAMSPESFRKDLAQALAAIQDVTGTACVLYRAPSYSVTRRSLWALDILADEGIEIDSSIYPVHHDRYGIVGTPPGPYRPLRSQPGFVEFPPSTVRICGVALPCAGGGYLRVYPLSWTLAAIRRINRRERRPAMVYVHPWELDSEQPSVLAGLVSNLRHRVNLGRTADRVKRLLREFSFGPVSRVIENLGGPGALPFACLERPASRTG
jgi:polysaccharide deacetylase family protein (PEP-CTERM system associated)